MADQNPLAGMPLAASLASNMNDSLQWMARLWGAAGGEGGAAAQASVAPGVPSMLMPTFDPDELEKRIADLRTVAHWLDMNRTLLQTTIQTLEMQRNAIVAMQSMARSAQSGGAIQAAGAGAAASGVETPAFDPTVWWNALQEQFVRVATSAIADAQPSPSDPAGTRSDPKSPGP